MTLLKVTTIVTVLASTLLCGNVMAAAGQATLTNNLGSGVELKCTQNTPSGSTTNFSVSNGAYKVLKADTGSSVDPKTNNVTCSNIAAPDGGNPANSNFNFIIDCASGTCKFSMQNSGENWLECLGTGCSAGTAGTTSNNQTMTLTY